MLELRLLILLSVLTTASSCAWYSWNSCSQSCGGGYKSRVCKVLFWEVDRQYSNCNEFCYNRGSFYSGRCHCTPWRSGRCCQDCRHIHIPHCKPGRQACGGSPDSIRCTECERYFISAGYGQGCKTCDHFYYFNSWGSTRCSCMRGFTLSYNGYSCYDLNECNLGTHRCHHKCINTYGSYKCSCRPGYQLSIDGRTCIDIDECQTGVADCSQQCINLPGTYRCACYRGYERAGDGCCKDINECKANNGGCMQACINTRGSFHCGCGDGYRLDADKISCVDIDECLELKCQNGGTCLNYPGSATCECVKGLTGSHCENDINECEGFLKGACEDKCVNTFGSFHCECSGPSTLQSDGMSCSGGEKTSSVFVRYGIVRELLPRGCFTVHLTRCTDATTVDVFLSSTSPWFKLLTNTSITYTLGIVFVEVNKLSIPVSLSGLKIIHTNTGFVVINGPFTLKEIDGFSVSVERQSDCFSFTTTSNDIRDFLISSSFMKTVFQSIRDTLPDWLSFSQSGAEVLRLHDLDIDLLQGKEIQTGSCRGAPLYDNRLYFVLKFDSRFSISLHGDERETLAANNTEQFCLIIDICQNRGSSLFLLVPKESDGLFNFEIIDSVRRKYGINIRLRGIGISLINDIHATNAGGSRVLWNGDAFFTYRILRKANLWVDADTVITSDGDNFSLELTTRSDIFTNLNDMNHILKSIFLKELNFYLDAKSFGVLDITFKVFGQFYKIKLKNIGIGDTEAMTSFGGLQQRQWCGTNANVPGLFMALQVDVNPFQNIPILKDGLFDIHSKVYTYILTDPTPTSSNGHYLDIIQDTATLKEAAERLSNTVIVDMWQHKDLLDHELLTKLNDISNSADNFIETIDHFINILYDNDQNTFTRLVEIISDTWTADLIPLRNNAEDFLASIEHNVYVARYNFTVIINREISQLTELFQIIIDRASSHIMNSYRNPVGFGLKYKGTLNIFSWAISGLELEFDYSITKPGICGHFGKVFELLKDERAVRIYGSLSSGYVELTPFIRMQHGHEIKLAISANTPGRIIAQLQAETNVLGIMAISDIFLTSTGHYFLLQGKLWNTFMADLRISFKSSRNKIETFDVLGQFVVTSGYDSFYVSYVKELKKATKNVADETEKRLRNGQRAIDIAYGVFSNAKAFLTYKKATVQKATSDYNQASQFFQQANSSLIKAEKPYNDALISLAEAQKRVDSLCEIRSCRVCVSGIRCRRCWYTVFFFFRVYYPCCYYVPCLYSFLNPYCVAYNSGCMAVRALAYYALDSAKNVLRYHYLAYEAAKRVLSNAQLNVDKTSLALDIANDALDLAQVKFDAAEIILESAKLSLEAVKIVVRWGIKVLQYLTSHDIDSIIEVKNCGFDLNVISQDKTIFVVECELSLFDEGYKRVRLGVNFGSPLQSIWQAAKGTISTFVDATRRLSERRKREIKYDAINVLHGAIRKARNVDTTQDELDSFANDTIDTLFNTNGFHGNVSVGDYENRVEIFQEKCSVVNNVMSFFSDAVQVLFEMSNGTANVLNNRSSDETSIEDVNIDDVVSNVSINSIGINTDEAMSNFNISEDDINVVLEETRGNLTNDQLLLGINNFTNEAKSVLKNQSDDATDIDIINHWILAMENVTKEYFDNESCVSFLDCAHFAVFQLYELFEEENVPNMTESHNAISKFEDSFLDLLDNTSYTVEEVYSRTIEMQKTINEINDYDVFCSEPPKMLSKIGNSNVTEGSTLQLFCNATGNPKPQIWWYRDEEHLPNQNDTLLIIYGVTKADESRYRCIAGNLIANLSSEYAQVYVYDYIADLETVTNLTITDDFNHDSTNQSTDDGDLAMILGTTFGILLFLVLVGGGFLARLHIRKKSRKEAGPQTVADINMVHPTDSKPRFQSYLVASNTSLNK